MCNIHSRQNRGVAVDTLSRAAQHRVGHKYHAGVSEILNRIQLTVIYQSTQLLRLLLYEFMIYC